MSVVPFSPTEHALDLAPRAFELVQRLVKTNFVPDAYRNKPEEALACVLTGDFLGLHPLVALREINVIQGTPTFSAKMQRAILQRAGHRIWLEESTSTRCVMAGHRAGEPEHVQRVEWTLDRAKVAGLDGRENWRKNGQSMLVARATGELARLLASDALLGIAYNADEVRDGLAADEETFDLSGPPDGFTPPPPSSKTQRRSAKGGSQRAATQQPAVVPDGLSLPPLPGELEPPPTPSRPNRPPSSERGPIEPEPDAADRTAHKRADAIRIRTTDVLGEMTRDERLIYWSGVVGRPIESGLDLTPDDADAIRVALDALEQFPDGDDVQADDDEPAPMVEAWTVDNWKALRAASGLTQAQFLHVAREAADVAGVRPPPGSVAAIAAAPLRMRELLLARIRGAMS